jgi:hypothetical protein
MAYLCALQDIVMALKLFMLNKERLAPVDRDLTGSIPWWKHRNEKGVCACAPGSHYRAHKDNSMSLGVWMRG